MSEKIPNEDIIPLLKLMKGFMHDPRFRNQVDAAINRITQLETELAELREEHDRVLKFRLLDSIKMDKMREDHADELAELRREVARIADDYHPDNDSQAPLALQEMRDALDSLVCITPKEEKR